MGITARQVGKTLGDPPLRILADISFEVGNGEFVAITGRSGSGKSTLLYLLSTLDHCTEGHIELDGQDTGRLPPDVLSRMRNRDIGFVFQFHYLLSELTALENALMPARKAGEEVQRTSYAKELLHEFGLGERLTHFPRQLSGGELQRLAIARALVMQPRYLFADEPTGSLDSANGDLVMKIFQDINKKRGTTILMVTHDPDYARIATRQIHLVDGRLSSYS